MSTAGKIHHVVPPAVEEPCDSAHAFRERIALRCAEHDADFPKAVELEARVLCRAHRELRGAISALRGNRSFQGFHDALMGGRHFHLADVARLATEPVREARAAVRAMLSEFAAEIGEQLVPLTSVPLRPQEVLARIAEASGALVGEFARATADDLLDADEIASLERRNGAAKAASAQMDTLLAQAKAGLR